MGGPRLLSSLVAAAALLVPAVGRSDASHNKPAAANGIAVRSATSTSITLTWITDDERPHKRFGLFIDTNHVGATKGTVYTFTGLPCNTAHTFAIEAVGFRGKRSERMSVIAATTACAPPVGDEPTLEPAPRVPRESDTRLEEPPTTEPVSSDSREGRPEISASPPLLPSLPTAMMWTRAGAFVWHETDVSPERLGLELRESGFSWVAILLHDGVAVDPIEDDWITRFRSASGLAVGGWGVLRTRPEAEAELAQRLLAELSLDFYIANAEAEYKYSGDDGQSTERFSRSHRFVARFRQLEPDIAAAISSYCRADTQDVDWRAWSDSGFAFLPQAYVNDFGAEASPSACVEGAAAFFRSEAIHPTVGVYRGQQGEPTATRYADLLDQAGSVGFSVYLAETNMHLEQWATFGDAITRLDIASAGLPAEDQASKDLGCFSLAPAAAASVSSSPRSELSGLDGARSPASSVTPRIRRGSVTAC